MKDADTVTDPTDWAGTAATELQPVDVALRCQVCKEFFDTPMITSCAHTFCSLCIRRCLSHDGKCPTCRSNDQHMKLRRNWAIEDVVSAFTKARQPLLQLGREVAGYRQHGGVQSMKRKLQELSVDEDEDSGPARRKTRSQNRRKKASASPSLHEVSGDEYRQEDADANVVDDGKVACPICNARMKEEEVSPHMDRNCLVSTSSSKPAASMLGLKQARPNALALNGQERLSQLNYSLLSDAALRKKLGTLGIPNGGNKQLMTRRHKEWIDIYNANFDSSKPRTKRELLRDLDTWERTQGSTGRNNDDANGIMSKEFDGAAWAQKNDNEFKELIARARAGRKASQQTQVDSKDVSKTPNNLDPDNPGSTAVQSESVNNEESIIS